MADEKKETEEGLKSADAAAPLAPTVKKTSVKKKTAKKKAAKKKAVRKKAVENMADTQTTDTPPESKPVPPFEMTGGDESKPATTTSVAAAPSSTAAAQPAQAKINIQVKTRVNESSEETSMSTGAKSSSGFWVKVIFWLIILVLCFIYIRSLAKHPAEEAAQDAVLTETPAATSQETAGTLVPLHGVDTAEKADSADEAQSSSKMDESSPTVSAEAAPTTSQDSTDSAQSDAQSDMAMTSSTEPSQAAAEAVEAARSPAPDVASSSDAASIGGESAIGADEEKRMRDQHAESVSKILKEFDDLREAVQAEMEAMRNLRQAERELHQAMLPPPPAAYPPAWWGPAYSPDATGPQHVPDDR